MPTPPAASNRRSFVLDERIAPVFANDDLAGHERRVEPSDPVVGSAVAERQGGDVRIRHAAVARAHQPVVDRTRSQKDAPFIVVPSPSVVEPAPLRLAFPAATVVSHGPGCATVPAAGPLLPDDVARNTGVRREKEGDLDRVTRSRREPLIEKLITSTPSATAWSMVTEVGTRKAAAAVGCLPRDLVGRRCGRARAAANVAENCGKARGRDVRVAAAGRCRAGTVATEIARRVALPGQSGYRRPRHRPSRRPGSVHR